jgi:hypothetical protein
MQYPVNWSLASDDEGQGGGSRGEHGGVVPGEHNSISPIGVSQLCGVFSGLRRVIAHGKDMAESRGFWG